MMTCWYWSYPKWVQAFIQKIVQPKQSWTLNIKKHKSGDWCFSIPKYGIIKEALTGGTEKVIDHYFTELCGGAPEVGDKVTITVSMTKPAGGYHARIEQDGNPAFGYYVEAFTQKVVWLCPVNQLLFGQVPQVIYVQFSKCPDKKIRTNPGE